jgi:hypothetical protein
LLLFFFVDNLKLLITAIKKGLCTMDTQVLSGTSLD